MARVFLLAVLSEPKSAACVAKGMKGGMGDVEGRKTVIAESGDNDLSLHFPSDC